MIIDYYYSHREHREHKDKKKILATESTENTEMIEKRTVFVLGAGASCPYGYPSGAQLRKRICLDFDGKYLIYLDARNKAGVGGAWDLYEPHQVNEFTSKFFKSSKKSIDVYLAANPQSAGIGKYIIAFEIFDAEKSSNFREHAVEGQDWLSYLFNRLTEDVTAPDRLPDFSDGNVGFISFNYDRSLEHFLYESLRNSFTEVPEEKILLCLKDLRIIHVYGKTAPLEWEGGDYTKYVPKNIDETLLRKAARRIWTIYERQESLELKEAHELLQRAGRIFFLGFGYAPENMRVLKLPDLIPPGCEVYGTAFNRVNKEVEDILHKLHFVRKADPDNYKDRYETTIEPCDCLMLLRKYL